MSDPLHKMLAGGQKALPEVPDMDTQLALAAKMIDKKTATHKGQHSYGSYFLEYSLMAEFNLLLKQRLPGIYCIPSHGSSLTWFGVLFIRQGPYQGGVFRFQVLIPDNYPDGDVPRIVFDGPVFHPNIDPATHTLNVKQGFHKWKRNVNHIWQLLLYTRRAFYKVEAGGAVLNTEAGRLWEGDRQAFQQRAASCVTDWREQLYLKPDPTDPHYLSFSRWEPGLHGPVRQRMLRGAEEEGGAQDRVGGGAGRSYLSREGGSLTIFSEPLLPPAPGPAPGPQSLPK